MKHMKSVWECLVHSQWPVLVEQRQYHGYSYLAVWILTGLKIIINNEKAECLGELQTLT